MCVCMPCVMVVSLRWCWHCCVRTGRRPALNLADTTASHTAVPKPTHVFAATITGGRSTACTIGGVGKEGEVVRQKCQCEVPAEACPEITIAVGVEIAVDWELRVGWQLWIWVCCFGFGYQDLLVSEIGDMTD